MTSSLHRCRVYESVVEWCSSDTWPDTRMTSLYWKHLDLERLEALCIGQESKRVMQTVVSSSPYENSYRANKHFIGIQIDFFTRLVYSNNLLSRISRLGCYCEGIMSFQTLRDMPYCRVMLRIMQFKSTTSSNESRKKRNFKSSDVNTI